MSCRVLTGGAFVSSLQASGHLCFDCLENREKMDEPMVDTTEQRWNKFMDSNLEWDWTSGLQEAGGQNSPLASA